MPLRKLQVGIIGVGGMGRVHAENLALRIPETELVGITDVNFPAAKSVSEGLGVKNYYAEYREMLENPRVEAVAIAVPAFAKHEIILDSIKAGKHIFCEKPLTLSLESADQIRAGIQKAGVKF